MDNKKDYSLLLIPLFFIFSIGLVYIGSNGFKDKIESKKIDEVDKTTDDNIIDLDDSVKTPQYDKDKIDVTLKDNAPKEEQQKYTKVLLMDNIDNGLNYIDFTNRLIDELADLERKIEVTNGEIKYNDKTIQSIDTSNIISIRLECSGNGEECDYYYLTNDNVLHAAIKDDINNSYTYEEIDNNVSAIAVFEDKLASDYHHFHIIKKDLSGNIKEEEKYNFYNNSLVIGGWSYEEMFLVSKDYEPIMNKYLPLDDNYIPKVITDENGNNIIGKTYNYNNNTGLLVVIDSNNDKHEIQLK